MEISRRADYAIRLIAALLEQEGRPLSVREAAARQDVPYAFARSIQHDLAQAGLLTTVRGAQGGMMLAFDPAKLSLLDLIEAVQGPVSVAVCTRDTDWCPRHDGCPFHEVWHGADRVLRTYLGALNIKAVIEGHHPGHPEHHPEHHSEP